MVRISTNEISRPLEYPHEMWTHKLLAEHIKKNSITMGFPEASKISSGTISKILGASNIKPHKILSYIHQVDPDFDSKSVIVLHTYKKVELSASKKILRVFDNIMRDEHGEQ